MLQWQLAAWALLQAQEEVVHSGTMPCERMWANFSNMLPKESRTISKPWFQLLNSLGYLRINYKFFNRKEIPSWCESDPLLAENLDDLT